VSIIDQILDAATRLAAPAAGVLFAARYPINYQRGCGAGRPTYGERVLLVRPAESATWRLPESIREVAPSGVFFDQAEKFGDALLVRGCVEFRPALDESKYEHCWTDAQFAQHCTSNHPSATSAIKQFTAAKSGTLKGDSKMSNSHAEFSAAQLKADFCYRAFGDAAPPPMNGETVLEYRTRLAQKFQRHSKTFADAKLANIGCPHTLTALEDQIYADAVGALNSGGTAAPGQLVPITKMDSSGRPITKYVASDDGACWNQFNQRVRYVTRFRTSRSQF
jgi:hypothetical protein